MLRSGQSRSDCRPQVTCAADEYRRRATRRSRREEARPPRRKALLRRLQSACQAEAGPEALLTPLERPVDKAPLAQRDRGLARSISMFLIAIKQFELHSTDLGLPDSTAQGRARSRPLRGALQARPPQSRADDFDLLRFPSTGTPAQINPRRSGDFASFREELVARFAILWCPLGSSTVCLSRGACRNSGMAMKRAMKRQVGGTAAKVRIGAMWLATVDDPAGFTWLTLTGTVPVPGASLSPTRLAPGAAPTLPHLPRSPRVRAPKTPSTRLGREPAAACTRRAPRNSPGSRP